MILVPDEFTILKVVAEMTLVLFYGAKCDERARRPVLNQLHVANALGRVLESRASA
jgi:hypothetical protein